MASLRSRFLHRTLEGVTHALDMNLSIQEQRSRFNSLARRGIRLPRGVSRMDAGIRSINCEWFEPENLHGDKVILYLHGGGYCICSLETHQGLMGRIALAAQSRVLAVDYRLAPEFPFPSALEDALAAYKWLVSEGTSPKNIIIAGDSAGGGLTISTAVTLRDEEEILPGALILLSPWTDLTFTGASIITKKQVDPIFSQDIEVAYVPAYAGKNDPSDPLISPLFANLQKLPPTLIHVGTDEILLDDSTRLYNRLKSEGVKSEIKIWEGMWHVFPAYAPWVPEAQHAIDEMGEFIRNNT